MKTSLKAKKCSSLSALSKLKKHKILKRRSASENFKSSPGRSLRSNTPSQRKKIGVPKRVSFSSPLHVKEDKTPVKKDQVKPSASSPAGSGSGGLPPPYEISVAEKCFHWLISPLTPAQFYKEVFEKRAFVVRRHDKDYYKGLFSCKELDKILREKHIKYTEDIDVTSYINGIRKTHNGDGRAYAAVIWDAYQTGHSVRLLKPQAYSKSIWKLCLTLSEYFGNFVGGNVYLTPPGTQGFAPHYDDIEAFVLQLEGHKKWKVYNPINEAGHLPRFSSGTLSQDDVGEEFLDVTLDPGDLLYFPRGFIHQANTDDNEHSLHLTVSACQRSTWGDLLEKLLPRALESAFEENIEYRRCLPRDYLSYMGVVNCDNDSSHRNSFLLKLKQLTEGLSKHMYVDAAVDQMGKDYVHSALPPIITAEEKSHSIHGDGEFWKNGVVHNTVEIDLDTKVRLLRKNAIRIVMEEEAVRIYHSLENTLVYKEVDPQYVEVSCDLVPAVGFLIETYPKYVAVQDLPLNTDDEKLNLSGLLYDKGLLMSEYPLLAPDD